MRQAISDTAEYGDYSASKKIITEETKKTMKKILGEIQNGNFAKQWILENQANRPAFNARKREEQNHQIETVGKELRGMMSWLNKEDKKETK